MGNCKIVYGGEVLLDLSQDSVTPETLDEGVTAHDKDGNPIVGTRPAGGGAEPEMCTVTIANAFTPKKNTVGTEFFLWVLLSDLKDDGYAIDSLFDYYSDEDGFVATVPKKSFCFVGGFEIYESEGHVPGMLEEFERTMYSVSVSGDIPWYSPHGTTPASYRAYMIWVDGDCTITIGEDD